MKWMVEVKRDAGASMPIPGGPGDVGWDLACYRDMEVLPGQMVDVPTGVRICMPSSMTPGRFVWCRLVGRSSALRNWGLLVGEGIIDGDYTGELFFGVFNPGNHPVRVPRGTRLAQLIFQESTPVRMEEISPEANWHRPVTRGDRGFGSTGR